MGNAEEHLSSVILSRWGLDIVTKLKVTCYKDKVNITSKYTWTNGTNLD